MSTRLGCGVDSQVARVLLSSLHPDGRWPMRFLPDKVVFSRGSATWMLLYSSRRGPVQPSPSLLLQIEQDRYVATSTTTGTVLILFLVRQATQYSAVGVVDPCLPRCLLRSVGQLLELLPSHITSILWFTLYHLSSAALCAPEY